MQKDKLVTSVGRSGGSSTHSPFVPVVSDRIGSYASNGLSAGDANHVAVTYRTRHFAAMKFSQVRLVYANWQPGDNDAGSNDITIAACVDDNAGNLYQLTFNGSRRFRLSPGATIVSDPIGLSFNESDMFYIRSYVAVDAAGGKWANCMGHMYGANEGVGQGDLTVTGSAAVPDVHEWLFAPMAILGIPNQGHRPFVVLEGDSIVSAVASDQSFGAYAAATAKLGVLNCGIPGYTLGFGTSQNTLKYRSALYNMLGVTHAVVLIGANDFNNGGGVTYAVHKANMTDYWAKLRTAGIQKIWTCTVLPRTNGANTAVVTQRFATGGDRGQYNNWLRAGADGLIDGYFETADAVESSRDSGLWKDVSYTADGVHPSNIGAQALADAMDLTKLS